MKKPLVKKAFLFKKLSGWQDSNLRPPAPKAGAMNRATLHPENYLIF